jgi:hypothetical protein
MRRTSLFSGIFITSLFLSASVFAQIKLSADTSTTAKTNEKSTTAKTSSATESKANTAGVTGASGSLKTSVAAEPNAKVEAKAALGADVAASANAEAGKTVPAAEQGAGTTTTSAQAQEAVDSSTYTVRLRDLEQRINELKEQVFRSKARLSLLGETILQGAVSGSQSRLIHENRMGSSYLLIKVVYALDGAPIYNKTDEEGGLNDQDTFDIYNGSMVPGEHTITANLEYTGRGFGIFSYLKGYRFKVKSSHTFNAPEGKAITIRVVSYEKGGPTAPLEERPAIRYVERVTSTGAKAESEKGGK